MGKSKIVIYRRLNAFNEWYFIQVFFRGDSRECHLQIQGPLKRGVSDIAKNRVINAVNSVYEHCQESVAVI